MKNTANLPDIKINMYREEALLKSLDLQEVFREDSNLYGTYKRLGCGHTTTKQLSSVRHSKSTSCLQCSDEFLKERCEIKGLEFLGAALDDDVLKRRFRVKSCGHTFDLFYSNITKNSNDTNAYKCSVCYEQEFSNLLLRKNLTEIELDVKSVAGKTRQSQYGTFRFNKCGHVFNAIRNRLSDVSDKCAICQEIEFIELVRIRNLTLNGPAVNLKLSPRYSNFTFNKCGHTRDIDRICVVRNNFKCHECNNTFTKESSNIYLFKIGNENESFLKLGYGKNVLNRIREYGLTQGLTAELLHSIPIENGRIAMSLETEIHNSLLNLRLDPIKMKMYFRRTGHTECYPLHMQDYLIYRINSTLQNN